MNRVLNRIAWICSLALGTTLSHIFSEIVGYGLYESFDKLGLASVYYWSRIIIFTLLSKKFILSKRFVENGLSQLVEEKASQLKADDTAEKSVESLETTPIPEVAPVEKEISSPADKSEEEALPDVKDGISEIDPKPVVDATDNVVSEKEIPVPKEPNFIQKFFAENLVAKVGGILLFLGVLFLLKLVYSAIGPVGKLSIGFAIGFTLYGIGMLLDKKKLITESRVLIGTGILINYLVILSGRFLIGDGTFTDQMLLNEGITFLLLIINTVLAIATSLLYRSYTLLFFSFIIAFLNPFLIGASASGTPYTLVGYGMIVALGSLALNWVLKADKNLFLENLLTISFVGGNLLFLVAPFASSGHWLIKLAATGLLSLLVIFTEYKSRRTERIAWYFLGAYLFLIALLSYGRVELAIQFDSGFVLFGYLLFILIILISTVVVFSATSVLLVFATLALPLVVLLGLAIQSVYIENFAYILTTTLAIYVGIFAIIGEKLALKMQYLFFGVLGLFVCLAGLVLHPLFYDILEYGTPIIIPVMTGTLSVLISAFIFQLSAYYFSAKKDLQYLYSMGTGITILLLLSVIQRQGDRMLLSIISIGGFLILNLILPFVNKSILESKIKNLVLGLVAGVLFTAGEIYYFGEMYFSGLEIGLAFLCQAILYFGLGYAMYNKLLKTSTESAQDVIYTLLGISISLFSLAIAFVFSRNSEVVAAVWLFEAALLFFFYSRDKDLKLFAAASILMAIGISKLFELIYQIESGEFLSLIPLSVIFAALVVILKFLEKEKREFRWVHDVLHLAGLALLGILLVIIIPSHGHGFSILGCSMAAIVLTIVYGRIHSHKLGFIFAAGLILFFIFQISMQPRIQTNLSLDSLPYLIVLQYLSTILLGCSVYFYNKLLTKLNSEDLLLTKTILQILNASYAIYLLIITTMYVFNLFGENSFSITIYWGLVTFGLLSYGIQKNVIRWRTIGLYLLILTVSKILLYDVWQELDAAVFRILALMLVGALMIVISILYQKKFDGNLLKELQPQNLK